MTPILETSRLILREFNKQDGPFILKLLNSPGWLKYIGDRNVRSLADAERYLESGPVKSYSINGYGLSCVAIKQSNEPIGMCGFVWRVILPDADLGFAIDSNFEGKGFMFEIANAYISYAGEQLRLSRILGLTTPDNMRSISLLKRLGFTYRNEFILPGQAEPLLLFRLDLNPQN